MPNAEWKALSQQIDDALADLPDEMRELLVEHYMAGVPHRELAERLGVSVPTVSRRIQEAIERLKAMLLRRGVTTVAVAGVAHWLAVDSVRAAPPALMREVGKMMMVSHRTPAPPAKPEVPSYQQVATAKLLAAGVVVGLVLSAAAMVLVGMLRPPAPQSPPPETHMHP